MKATEVRTKSDDELKTSLIGLRKEAFNLRFQRASGQLENTARVRALRREIARIKTILTERRKPRAGARRAHDTGATSAVAAKPKTAPAKKVKSAKSKSKTA